MTSLAMRRVQALRAIDAAADAARQRYRPQSQQVTDWVKLQEARAFKQAYALDAAAPAPRYVAAEALRTGQDPIDVAEAIDVEGSAWHDTINPGLEGARRAGKVAVREAADPAAVDMALAAALAELESYTGP